jgi:serine/threonine protein kinase
VPQSSAVASLLEPGFKLGRYRLLEPIGAGGMGEVWKAHDDNLDRDVAVKMLLRGTLGHATRRERFRREALVLSRLSHPGVATIFDFDVQQGYDFLVMEYVAGGTLESRIRSGPLPIDDILTIGAAIADALDNAHRHGILHRDLKPGNVVMTADGHPKILDFGLAVLLSGGNDIGRMTQPGMIVGSLPYMAPEQLFGEADDARTDIYALGVLLFEMITGNRPFVKDRPESFGGDGSTDPSRNSRWRDDRNACASSARRHSRDCCAPAEEHLERQLAGILHRRNDGGDHIGPRAHQGAEGHIANVGDDLQGSIKARSGDCA